MATKLFVWAIREPRSIIQHWAHPRQKKDNTRLKEHIEVLTDNCYRVQVNKRTLAYFRDLLINYPKDLLMLWMEGDPLTSSDLIDELNRLYDASPGEPP